MTGRPCGYDRSVVVSTSSTGGGGSRQARPAGAGLDKLDRRGVVSTSSTGGRVSTSSTGGAGLDKLDRRRARRGLDKLDRRCVVSTSSTGVAWSRRARPALRGLDELDRRGRVSTSSTGGGGSRQARPAGAGHDKPDPRVVLMGSDCYSGVAQRPARTYSRYMSAQHPSSGPVVEGPHDPEHDPTASYALDRSYVWSLTSRVVASSDRTVEVRSPLGDQPLAHIPQSTAADVDEAFRRARRAQEQWARTPIDVRAAALLRLHDLVLDRQRGDHRPDLLGVGQGPQARVRRAAPHRADRSLLRAHRPPAPRHPPRPRRLPGAHPGRAQPGAQGRRRHHLAVELPVHDGAVRRAPRAPGRQRGRGQARRPDHAVGAARGPSCSRRPASRPTSGRSSPAPAPRSAPS